MLQYLQSEWFSSSAYLKIDNRPVLTNFAWGSPGSNIKESWFSSAEWNEILDTVNPRPVFIHDWHKHRQVNEFAGFESVMPWGCTYHGNRDSAGEFWQQSKDAFEKHDRFMFISAAVLPGFDNRGCEGWGSDGAIGMTDRRRGEKFHATWKDCLQHDPKFIQIATWNDLNEGGTIEPVKKVVLHEDVPAMGYGYRELETVAHYAGKMKGVKYDKAALRIPAEIYFERKSAKNKQDNIAIDKKRDELLKECLR